MCNLIYLIYYMVNMQLRLTNSQRYLFDAKPGTNHSTNPTKLIVTVSGNPNPTNPTTKYRCEFVNLNCIYTYYIYLNEHNSGYLHFRSKRDTEFTIPFDAAERSVRSLRRLDHARSGHLPSATARSAAEHVAKLARRMLSDAVAAAAFCACLGSIQ